MPHTYLISLGALRAVAKVAEPGGIRQKCQWCGGQGVGAAGTEVTHLIRKTGCLCFACDLRTLPASPWWYFLESSPAGSALETNS